jgi:hypothetical protein
MTTNEAIIMIVVGVSIYIFIAGYILGQLVEKRKRDKEMAGIVAERLLRSQRYHRRQLHSCSGGWQNASMNQQIGGMQGQQGMLGSLMGGNPGISQGFPGMFSTIKKL